MYQSVLQLPDTTFPGSIKTKCAKERNDYIRKQKYLEIQKTGKSFVTSGKTCTNTFVLLD